MGGCRLPDSVVVSRMAVKTKFWESSFYRFGVQCCIVFWGDVLKRVSDDYSIV